MPSSGTSADDYKLYTIGELLTHVSGPPTHFSRLGQSSDRCPPPPTRRRMSSVTVVTAAGRVMMTSSAVPGGAAQNRPVDFRAHLPAVSGAGLQPIRWTRFTGQGAAERASRPCSLMGTRSRISPRLEDLALGGGGEGPAWTRCWRASILLKNVEGTSKWRTSEGRTEREEKEFNCPDCVGKPIC